MNYSHLTILTQVCDDCTYGLDGTLYYVPNRLRNDPEEYARRIFPRYAIISNQQVKVTIPVEDALGSDEKCTTADANMVANWFDTKDALIDYVAEQKKLEMQDESFLSDKQVRALTNSSI